MGLAQSLYTGWSGLATHQRSMDNSSNNLANVNTVGFKKNDFQFSDLFSNVMRGAMPTGGVRANTNPISLGLGVTTGAIQSNFTQGPIEGTNNPLDVAINGNGFFMAATSSGTALTRNGSFYLDHTVNPNERLLCVGDGLPVQGWNAANGTITPSTTVGNIYLPASGDILPGNNTTKVNLRGILPTNTASADFTGMHTTDLSLKGNLSGDGQSMMTRIYAPVTQIDGTTATKSDSIEPINVRLDFAGPTLSADGTTNTYSWTMTTVDWPNAGDPGIQIYPPAGDPAFTRGGISFYAQANPAEERGAGEVVSGLISPGSAKVRSEATNANGATVATFFEMPGDFELDVSRLTSMDDAPGGSALQTWHVNGNPKGTMARTITTYDEYTEFLPTTDAGGNAIMEAVRRVQARENTLLFNRTSQDDVGSYWAWESATGEAGGTLAFNTIGDLTAANQTSGGIAYDFSEVRSINSAGILQVLDQDGYQDGYLQDVTIDQYGKIWGHYTNEVTEPLAQLAMATVPNPYGLDGASGTLFYPGSASGNIMVGVAGDQDGAQGLPAIGAGYLSAGALEGSNVEMSKEFTNLINIQRGYQFNSKTITTTDQMLQTALGLKR